MNKKVMGEIRQVSMGNDGVVGNAMDLFVISWGEL